MIVVLVTAAAVVLTLPLLFIALRLVWRTWQRQVPLRAALLSPGVLISIALTFVGYAALVYAVGLFSSFYFLDPDQMCAARAGFHSGTPGPPDSSWLAIEDNYFPLHHTCRWADGTAYELVPAWVNPLFYAFVAVAWLALLARPLVRLVTPDRGSTAG